MPQIQLGQVREVLAFAGENVSEGTAGEQLSATIQAMTRLRSADAQVTAAAAQLAAANAAVTVANAAVSAASTERTAARAQADATGAALQSYATDLRTAAGAETNTVIATFLNAGADVVDLVATELLAYNAANILP